MSINTKNRFSKLVNRCKVLSYASARTKSPETKMRLIMNCVEKINAIDLSLGNAKKSEVEVTESLRGEAIAKCWEYYAKVLKFVDSTKDESWNGAVWNSAKGEMEYDNIYFYGSSNELDDYVGAELSGSNSMTKVIRYD